MIVATLRPAEAWPRIAYAVVERYRLLFSELGVTPFSAAERRRIKRARRIHWMLSTE